MKTDKTFGFKTRSEFGGRAGCTPAKCHNGKPPRMVTQLAIKQD